MARSDFSIRVAEERGWTVAGVSGEIDMATAPELEALTEAGSNGLALDLSGVRFIDSSGLRALLRIQEATSPFVLLSPSPVVRKLLALTNMVDMFDIRDSADELGA